MEVYFVGVYRPLSIESGGGINTSTCTARSACAVSFCVPADKGVASALQAIACGHSNRTATWGICKGNCTCATVGIVGHRETADRIRSRIVAVGTGLLTESNGITIIIQIGQCKTAVSVQLGNISPGTAVQGVFQRLAPICFTNGHSGAIKGGCGRCLIFIGHNLEGNDPAGTRIVVLGFRHFHQHIIGACIESCAVHFGNIQNLPTFGVGGNIVVSAVIDVHRTAAFITADFGIVGHCAIDIVRHGNGRSDGLLIDGKVFAYLCKGVVATCLVCNSNGSGACVFVVGILNRIFT